jgi:hypothetical protein
MSRAEESLSTRSAGFLATAARQLRVADLSSLTFIVDQPPVEAERVFIDDPCQPTPCEISALANGFNSRFAMVAFECRRTEFDGDHPLLKLGWHLREVIAAKWPVRSSPNGPDCTTKIQDIGAMNQPSRSLTSQPMAAHQDGWLSLRDTERGVLAVTGLWTDSAAVECAATFSQNIVRLSLDLWRTDEEAFVALFAEDAVKIVDRAGVVVALSPVLSVNKGRIHAFFRGRDDEYDVLPGSNAKANARAIDFLNAYTSFGSGGSAFTYLDRRGRGLLLNNRQCIHGRTAFRDGDEPAQKRVIAAKWWTSDDDYKDLVWA